MINQFIGGVAEGLGQRWVDVTEFAILNQIDPRQRPFGDNGSWPALYLPPPAGAR
jgi:hypothetical protein